jgi:L-rhamnose-H+ transport protein
VRVQNSFITGLAIVLAAGVFQGSFMFPSKWMKGWAWENYWLIFASVAYLISPWLLAMVTVPHLGQVYASTTPGTFAIIFVFGLAWGLGALTFGLGVDAVGLALGFAVILGIAASAGAVIPLIVRPPQHITSAQVQLTFVAIAIMLAGVAVCSFAGRWRESPQKVKRQSYAAGIALCVASGLLSSGGNLGFVFGSDVAASAQSLGTPSYLAGNAVWTLLAIPLFLCNAGYAAVLLFRNGTAASYSAPGSGRKWLLAFSMGAMWMAGMSLYGMGARRMGTMGASVGWAVLMSSMVLMANVLGLASGEWTGAPPRSRRQLMGGLLLLLIAIAALGYTNHMAAE